MERAVVGVGRLLLSALVVIGRLLVWILVAGGRLLRHAVISLLRAGAAAGRWARPRAVALGRGAISYSRAQVAAMAESMHEVSFPTWDLSSVLPAASSPLIPIIILIAAVVIAATLGGVLAAALS